jgi:hypothetical protein
MSHHGIESRLADLVPLEALAFAGAPTLPVRLVVIKRFTPRTASLLDLPNRTSRRRTQGRPNAFV